MIKEMLEMVIKSMVDKEELVNLTEVNGANISTYELVVDNNDVGKILGKQGRNINAIRTILTAASTKNGRKSNFEIISEFGKNTFMFSIPFAHATYGLSAPLLIRVV